MIDEHDPRYTAEPMSNTPQSEAHVGGREFARLEAKVAFLEQKLEEMEEREEDRLSTLDTRVDGLETRFTLSKGLLSGVLIGLSLVSFFVVDTVKDILAHVYDFVSHSSEPP